MPELLLGLGAAVAIGGLFGWWFRAVRSRGEIAEIDGRWARTNRDLARDRDRTRAAYDETSLRYAELERRNDERGVRLREMEAERDSAESISATAKAELERLRKRVKEAESSQGGRDGEVDSLQRELAHRMMAIETLQLELAVAQESRAQQDADLQRARNRIVRFEGELAQRDTQLNTLQGEWNRMREERDGLDRELLVARDDLAETRAARTDNAQAGPRRERVAELERLLGIERNQSAVLREELREQSQQIALLEDSRRVDAARDTRIEELEEQLEELDRETERARGELEAVRSMHRFKEQEALALQHRVTELEAKLASGRTGVTVEAKSMSLHGRPSWLLSAPDGEPDDLKQIRGVGPAFERSMNALGIYHFRQIASWAPEDVRWTSDQIDAIRGRIERDDWIDQAAELHEKKYGSQP